MSTRLRPSAAQLGLGLTVLLVCVALGVVAAWPVYGDVRVVTVAVVGTAVGAGTAVIGAWARWRWWLTASVAVLAYAAVVVPTAIPSAMSGGQRFVQGIGEGLAGAVLGWRQLLTISIPAGQYQAVLVPFLVTVVVCTLVAAMLILSASRWTPLAVVPMLALPLFGAVFGSSAMGADRRWGPLTLPAPEHVALGATSLAVVAAWLVLRARLERAAAIRLARSNTGTVRLGRAPVGATVRRQLTAVGLLVTALIAAVALAPAASSWGPREVPRDRVDPLLVMQGQPSPLAQYRDWFTSAHHGTALFTVDGNTDGDRLRLATLDAYDGNTFHVSGDQAPARMTRQPQVQADDITITIDVADLGVWVPLVDAGGGAPRFEGARAEQLADAYYASQELNTGIVVIADAQQRVAGLQQGDSYQVSAQSEVDTSGFGSAIGGDPLVGEEDHPALAAWVASQDVGRTGADLVELSERLRARGYLSHAAREDASSTEWVAALQSRASYEFHGSRPGHSAARIDELFQALLDQESRAGANAGAAALVAGVGDDEQFAAAVALLARYLGFESRVVVGVRLGAEDNGLGVPACEQLCEGRHLTAWVETRALGGTWVPIDATPQFEVAPELIHEGQTPPQNPTDPQQIAAEVIDPPTLVAENTTSASQEPPEDPTWVDSYLPLILTIVALVIGAVLMVLPALVFPIAKRRRRRRRRLAPVPEVLLVGAWDELIDRYVDLGWDVPHSLTRAETADVLDRPAAASVATLVDSGVFAEHPPTREVSAAAWELLDAERDQVASESTRWQRFRAVFTPASFTRTLRSTSSDAAVTLRRKDRHVAR